MMIKKLIASLGFLTAFAFADDFTVVALNDFHGQVMPNKDMVGMAKISTFLQEYKKTHPNLVIVLSGDNYQGTAISNLSMGAVDNEIFNYIGVNYSTLGNHDFDYGQEIFKTWQKTNNFPFLASNVTYKVNGQPFEYAKPYAESMINGKKVVFVGLATLETYDTTAAKNINNLEFNDQAKSTNYWLAKLNYKPDAVIAITHIPTVQESDGSVGYNDNSHLKASEIKYLVNNTPALSGVFTAHSHQKVIGFIESVPVIQGASQGKDLSVIHYNCMINTGCVGTPELIDLSVATANLASDKQVDKIIDKYYEKNKYLLNHVLTTTTQNFPNHPESETNAYNSKLTYTVANISRLLAHADVGLQNTGGVRRSLPQGKITYGMLYETLPFDNTLVVVTMKGKDLKDVIRHALVSHHDWTIGVLSGVSIAVDKSGTLISAKIKNKEIVDEQIYSVATIDFLVNGGDGFDFSQAISIKDTNLAIREQVKSYIVKHGLILPQDWQNVKIVD